MFLIQSVIIVPICFHIFRKKNTETKQYELNLFCVCPSKFITEKRQNIEQLLYSFNFERHIDIHQHFLSHIF